MKVSFDMLRTVQVVGETQCKALYLLGFPNTRLHIKDYISTLFQSEETKIRKLL